VSQFNARRRGLNLVSKFDTTANFTPDFLRALNTSSASGSLRCHACMDDRQKKKYKKLSDLFLRKMHNTF